MNPTHTSTLSHTYTVATLSFSSLATLMSGPHYIGLCPRGVSCQFMQLSCNFRCIKAISSPADLWTWSWLNAYEYVYMGVSEWECVCVCECSENAPLSIRVNPRVAPHSDDFQIQFHAALRAWHEQVEDVQILLQIKKYYKYICMCIYMYIRMYAYIWR